MNRRFARVSRRAWRSKNPDSILKWPHLGRTTVAQTSGLPCRRSATCGLQSVRERVKSPGFCRLQVGDTADRRSALLLCPALLIAPASGSAFVPQGVRCDNPLRIPSGREHPERDSVGGPVSDEFPALPFLSPALHRLTRAALRPNSAFQLLFVDPL